MNCPQCNRVLSAFKTYTHHVGDVEQSERLEYTCTFDGTHVVVDDPELQAAHAAVTGLYAKHSETLHTDLQARKELLNELMVDSVKDKAETEKKLKAIEKRIGSFEKFLTQNKTLLQSNLGEASEKLLRLESGPETDLTKVEMTGLRIYVESQKRELLRVESYIRQIRELDR